MTISRKQLRALVLTATLPFAFFGYQALPVAAATPTCDGQAATLVVGSGSPAVVHGTSHRDVVVVKDPGHVVRLGAGADLACGSSGRDTVFGGGGPDRILGFAGADALHGGSAADLVSGGVGDDDEWGDDGDDVLHGNAGDDDLQGDDGDDELVGDAGDDDLQGEQGDDVLEGEDGNDDCEQSATSVQQCDDADDDDQGENEDVDGDLDD